MNAASQKVHEILNKAATIQRNIRTSSSGISAQDIIQLPNASIRSGLLRKKANTINYGRWKHRFVVLLSDSLYIYNSELSKAPNDTILLRGYNRVQREESTVHEWCFSILPAYNLKTVRVITFACVSDNERREWMTAIKDQLYIANGVEKKSLSDSVQRRLTLRESSTEDEYRDIEAPAYVPDGSVDSDHLAYTDSISSDSGSSGSGGVFEWNIPSSPPSTPAPTPPSDTHSNTSSPPDLKPKLDNKRKPMPLPKPETVPKPKPQTPEKKKISQEELHAKLPPRQSAILSENETDYVNAADLYEDYDFPVEMSQPPITKEQNCTVADDTLDRNQLIAQLKAKEKSGTYLIRKSRTSDYKVLAYLTPEGKVNQYKIFKKDSTFSLDQIVKFDSIETLLEHYSTNGTLPSSDYKLLYGFYEE
ncbi:SH3 domain-binding protein 2-like [Physella acuta]|uniref:SH3 domain-binding protein 2-like n=1 Tax=Physella acuta TaxID=109671 RepID=UPI0027DDAEB2|nr:SH3 domain-binding protein 2-like [Physella acuta]